LTETIVVNYFTELAFSVLVQLLAIFLTSCLCYPIKTRGKYHFPRSTWVWIKIKNYFTKQKGIRPITHTCSMLKASLIKKNKSQICTPVVFMNTLKRNFLIFVMKL